MQDAGEFFNKLLVDNNLKVNNVVFGAPKVKVIEGGGVIVEPVVTQVSVSWIDPAKAPKIEEEKTQE